MQFYKPVANDYKSWVYAQKPYDYFITVTFAKKIGLPKACKLTSSLLCCISEGIFRSDYNDKNCVKGFAFLEEHPMGNSKTDFHFHMLIQHNDKYSNFSLPQIKAILINATHRVNGIDRVFNDKCIDVEKVWDDGVIEYCFKQIWNKTLNCIKLIGKDGLSDNLDQ